MTDDKILTVLLDISRDTAATRATMQATAEHLAEHVEIEGETWAAVRRDLSDLSRSIADTKTAHDARLDSLEALAATHRTAVNIGLWVLGAAGAVGLALLGAAAQVSHVFSDWVGRHFG